jgi:gentisate 1,2-dioxygenase
MPKRLNAEPGDWARSDYKTSTGAYISKTLGAHAECVKSGKTLPPRGKSCSYVYHAVAGDGNTEIELSRGGAEMVQWQQGDTFAVSVQSRVTHHASSHGDAYLFVLSDRPAFD